MGKTAWTVLVSFNCIFWGSAVLFNQHQHHALSYLIPTLGTWLLTMGVGLMLMVLIFSGRES